MDGMREKYVEKATISESSCYDNLNEPPTIVASECGEKL
jgi:hypothetical protein